VRRRSARPSPVWRSRIFLIVWWKNRFLFNLAGKDKLVIHTGTAFAHFLIDEKICLFFCSNLAWNKVFGTLCPPAWPRYVWGFLTVCRGKPIYKNSARKSVFHINIGRNQAILFKPDLKVVYNENRGESGGTDSNVGELSRTAMRFIWLFKTCSFFVYKTFFVFAPCIRFYRRLLLTWGNA
jgi:hypothetical protein